MKTILHIVGNRPQFIKLAILYKELAQDKSVLQKIIHTGQHFSIEMSDIFFKQLRIPQPDINLKINTNQADLFIAEAAISLQEYFAARNEAIVFVYGDTNTTLAAAIAARRTNTPLFHFEAGVRTGDNAMPEEINRVLTDRMADVNYCCTSHNYQTMLAEGFGTAINSRIVSSGDLMYDAFLRIPQAEKNINTEKNYIACTIHRVNNILSKENLSAIIESLNNIHKEIAVVMPVHPHTKKRMEEYGLQPAFITINPLGYPEMKTFMGNSSYVITDSGGAAREAFFYRKKSVVVMNKPFWPEIIDASCSLKAAPEAIQLQKAFNQLPELAANFQSPIFGKGNAAELIAQDILSQ
ncbi:MAG TPA: UDP-N-acetyl glucosamine 2-epimerase [Chitinophagaceae bacterium]|nr:UDP-N-acetyl glucosamine 2-epimerase [Chitinophagaceae bacterium]